MMRSGATILAAVAIILALPHLISGECAAPGSICEAYGRAALVFVGEVELMEPAFGPARSGVPTLVRFRTIQRFKGDLGKTVDLTLNPSSEEFSYVKGQRVLVYANRAGASWSTACTRTRQVSASDAEALALQSLIEKRPGGVLDGNVQTPELLRSGPLKDIRIALRRDGVDVSELTTDSLGQFQTAWLTPGTYVLSIENNTRGVQGRREVVVASQSRCVSIGSIAR